MSSADVTLTLVSLTTPDIHPSLFVSARFANKEFFSTKTRRTDSLQLNESFTAEYDSDVHADDLVLEVRDGKTKIITSTTINMTTAGATTLNSDGCVLKIILTHATLQGLDLHSKNPLIAPAYLAIGALWLVVQHVEVPYWANLLALVLCLIYVGCHRSLSLRDTTPVLDEDGNVDESQMENVEVMTMADAAKFPFVGSASLFSLYCLFKYFDKDTINFIIGFYFTAVGCIAVAATTAPVFAAAPLPSFRIKRKILVKHPLPAFLLGPSPWDLSFDFKAEDILGVVFACTVGYYYFFTKKWILNNILGISFCIQGIERFSLGSFKVAAILLVGLFFYDIFWVFGTDVMVTVAKNLDGPIKLLFPRSLTPNDAGKLNLSLLGLGDIVIPGFVIGMLLRFDADNARLPVKFNLFASFPKPYFHTCLAAYMVGLATTLLVMIQFNAAQPALLYLVPACLGSTMACAWWRGEVKLLLDYTEGEEVVEEESKKTQ